MAKNKFSEDMVLADVTNVDELREFVAQNGVMQLDIMQFGFMSDMVTIVVLIIAAVASYFLSADMLMMGLMLLALSTYAISNRGIIPGVVTSLIAGFTGMANALIFTVCAVILAVMYPYDKVVIGGKRIGASEDKPKKK